MWDFNTWALPRLEVLEQALGVWVPSSAPAGLGDAMRYAVLDGGKRLRPLLALAAAQAVQPQPVAAPTLVVDHIDTFVPRRYAGAVSCHFCGLDARTCDCD